MRHIFYSFLTCFFLFCFLSALIFTSCTSTPVQTEVTPCSRELLGSGIKSSVQLQNFFFAHNSDIPLSKISLMAGLYIEEAAAEGINSDVAFVQMCLETGFLTFGNLVVPEMNNFCGLGAMDAEHPGEYFEDERTGVRAHIQHLQAYATTEEVSLNQPLVDPRYSWPHKVKFAVTVHDLAGSWATDPEYGVKLDGLLEELALY